MSANPPSSPLAALRKFHRDEAAVQERCELCGLALRPQHQHLIEPANRRLVCACDACAILFEDPRQNRYRRVPRRIQVLNNFAISDAQWESLHLPINLAFFYFSSPAQRVIAMFPSPAGATESLLPLEHWSDLVHANPTLSNLIPDVEALLVHRVGDPHQYFRVPIDECFKLVGIIRTHWRGLSGGVEVWKELALFTQSLEQRAG
ncbi:MAG TPA: DUF5947 family protein [Tepidisphaeraceae bacterium]|jgi:hypothetical protein